MANVNKRSREELAKSDPSSDYGDVRQMYPQLGRDVPWVEGPNGYPVMQVEVRVESYGDLGLRRETKCFHCGKWLSYNMCSPCQSAMRMFGHDDKDCSCFRDSVWVYGHCEDHRRFEHGPASIG